MCLECVCVCVCVCVSRVCVCLCATSRYCLTTSATGKAEDGEKNSAEAGPTQPPIEAVFGDDQLFKPRLIPTLPEFAHQTGEENYMVVVHVSGSVGGCCMRVWEMGWRLVCVCACVCACVV